MNWFTIPLELRFSDMDSMGHVNNAVYFSYFEQVRIAFLDSILGKKIRYSENGIILANAHADFKRPVVYRDSVIGRCRVSKIGTKSFEMEYEIVLSDGNDEVIAATGSTVMVCFDYTRNETMVMPDFWRSKLEGSML